MLVSLLFAMAVIGDSPAEVIPPPAPQPVVAAAPAQVEPLAPGKITDGPVPCNQPLGCGSSDPQPSVTIEDGFGNTLETSATWDQGAVKRSPDYSARLDAELCAVKPWYC